MDRSKIVAIITGAIALLVSIAYLLLVQLIDFRGEMQPAPITGQLPLVGMSGTSAAIASPHAAPDPTAAPQAIALELALAPSAPPLLS